MLLRGVNIGKRQLRMAELRELCADAGHQHVRTYVQSGNVVVDSTLAAAEVAADLEARLREHCGWEVPVVVRSAGELAAVIDACPFDRSVDATRLVVAFSPRALVDADLGGLDPDGFGDETFDLAAREVYFWLPDGQGRSALVKEFLTTSAGKICTARNWRTVTTLADWCRSDPPIP